MPTKKTEFAFETALVELEKLVNTLESGELSLEDSLKAFEQGISLTRKCQEALSTAEQRVNLLIEKNGERVATPFDDNLV